MEPLFTDHKAERDRLFSEYLHLSNKSQLFVQMLLFGLNDLPFDYLLRYLDSLKAKYPDFRLNHNEIKNIIKECKDSGVIVSSSGRSSCSSLLINLCARHSVESNNFVLINEMFSANPPDHYRFYYSESDPVLSEFNILRAICNGTLEHYLQSIMSSYYRVDFSVIQWHRYFNNPFNPDYLKNISDQLLSLIMRDVMIDMFCRMEQLGPACAFLEEKICSGHDPQGQLSYLLSSYLILTGQFEKHDSLRNKIQIGPGLIAFEAAVKGDNDTALLNFEPALKEYRKLSDQKQGFFDDFSGVLYLICLARNSSSDHIAKMLRLMKQTLLKGNYRLKRIHFWLKPFYSLFDYNGLFLKGKWNSTEFMAAYHEGAPVHVWISLLVGYWLGEKFQKSEIDILKNFFELTKERKYFWIASEMAELIFRITNEKSFESIANDLRGSWTSVSLVDSIKKTEGWERTLEILKSLNVDSRKTEIPVRLIWRIEPPERAGYFGKIDIQLIEQKRLKNGQWSAGKIISMNRIRDGYEYRELLTEQDKRAIAFLQRSSWGNDFSFDALAELAGHPEVYRNDDPSIHTEISLQEPHLSVLPEKNGFKVIMEPPLDLVHNEKYVFIEETTDRFVLFRINNNHMKIAEILGGNSFSVPASAKEMLIEALRAVSPKIEIRTDLDQSLENSEETEADSRPVVRLTGEGRGLKLEMMVRPLKNGKVFSIGKGPSVIYGSIDGRQFHTVRNFESEIKELLLIVNNTHVLNEFLEESNTASITDPHDCLEVLAELNSCDPSVELFWNKSTPLKIHSTKSRSFSLRKSGDWFSLEGEVQIDDGQVISFRKLIELLDSSDGRFIRLDENRFLALTLEFKHQLEQIRSLSTVSSKGVNLHPLSALALDSFVDEMSQVSVCKEWKANIEKFRHAFDKLPVVPSTFQGELREYQKEGFVWMIRLAEIGAGACLADDMGLGKTIQAIAVILHRAQDGPALVVGPTSVCMNWFDEIRRFAPTLNPLLFSESDREACVNSAKAGDVVICSYGLVNNESGLLSSKKWNTIVIDEAQAIKNIMTRRSKAVMGLQGAFRIVTTGTPVENHLGELWNIFNFIIPGLLGTIEEFNNRFANAIEQRNDPETKRRLKSIISPFILRRLKSQVLDELPPKTEVIIHIDMNSDERALYEALRRTALEELSSADKKGKHIKILAHIMKLRRACCHPSLVTPDITISGSKLENFGLCVDELLDNNHRALVFSQFVDHLSIVRSYCDKRGIEYQYLDGSTTARDRNTRISAFQAGKGSLFLMSLKAGGVGINLTGADYVILLDPWWNPAVEDQASGRAYRMGQYRPVTIYRLITKGTIEEKILELHKYKRDLAESLLEGGDMSGKISAEELMKMIRDAV